MDTQKGMNSCSKLRLGVPKVETEKPGQGTDLGASGWLMCHLRCVFEVPVVHNSANDLPVYVDSFHS